MNEIPHDLRPAEHISAPLERIFNRLAWQEQRRREDERARHKHQGAKRAAIVSTPLVPKRI